MIPCTRATSMRPRSRFRQPPHASWAGTVVAVALACLAGRAEAQAEAVPLTWNAPAGCPPAGTRDSLAPISMVVHGEPGAGRRHDARLTRPRRRARGRSRMGRSRMAAAPSGELVVLPQTANEHRPLDREG